MRKILCILGMLSCCIATAVAASFAEQFEERRNSVVAVEFVVQHVVEREPGMAMAVVIDDAGRAVMLDSALPAWLPPDRFKDFRVHTLGVDSEGHKAVYLGQDYLTGYHFIQIDEAGRKEFTPITSYGTALPERGDLLWGFGVMGEQWAFLPYFLSGRLSTIESLPMQVGFSDAPVASPGAVVFSEDGRFVGWAGMPVIQEKLLSMRGDSIAVGVQDMRESSMFVVAEDFLKQAKRIPTKPSGDEKPWLGVSGMAPLDGDVSRFLGLEKQGALVISDVIENSPAEAGGLQGRDIIVAIDGEPIPKYKPNFIIPRYFEMELMERGIGDKVMLSVIRGNEPMELEFTMGQQPTILKQAKREYFPGLGIGIRQFTLLDAIRRRIMNADENGVIADFVEPNSLANSAGLMPGDWIKEIDGVSINNFVDAQSVLERLQNQDKTKNFVLLISRNNETKVIRVKRQ